MIVSFILRDDLYIPAVEAFFGEKISKCHTKEEAMKVLPEADIIITLGGGGLLIDTEMLSVSKKLRLVLSVSAGVEKLPLRELHERGIAVCNTKGTQSVSIAEYVLGSMLAMCRHMPTFLKNQGKACWENILGSDLEGQTLCVIGTGSVGSEIAKKAKAFKMKVLGIKRRPERVEGFDDVWGRDKLHEALGQSDFIVIVTPLTPDTHHLLKANEFQVMKNTAVVINVSRGQTIDEAALINALQNRKIAGAVLDVFDIEPLPADNPLWMMENVMITPHNSALTLNAYKKITQQLCENIVDFRQGHALINQIKKNELY